MKKILLGLGFLSLALIIGLFTHTGIVRADEVADCSATPGSYMVDTSYHISNDPDSGNHGNWATDNFTRHIQIWQEDGHYCAQATDNGTFTTTGPNSPQSGDPLVAGITGSMTGRVSFKTETAPVATDSLEDIDCSAEGADCNGLTGKWINHYFGTIPSYDWGWKYETCDHGTWVNSATENSGDIFSESDGTICEEPTVPATSNSGNAQPWTPPVSIPTAPQCTSFAPSLGIANINVIRTSDTTAKVQWSLHSGDNTHIMFGEHGTGWHHAALNVGTSGEATINFLIPGRTYDWVVIPMNGCAAGGNSPVVSNI